VSSPIRRRRDGRYSVRLDANVRTVLLSLAQQLTPALDSDDPMTRRLFPPAYAGEGDEKAEQEYRSLVDTALVNHHRQALTVMAETANAESLSESEMHAWLSAVGSLRLVLGTRLDVCEDMEPPAPEDPSAGEYALFEFLGELQYLLIDVLAAELPDGGRPEGTL
jgi:hypothetical protein